MEKIINISINNKEYRFMESAYMVLSDYNRFLKRTIKDKNRLCDIEIQISVLLDMETENEKVKKIVSTEIMNEVISVLKENQKIYYPARRIKQKKQTYKRKTRKHSEVKRDIKNNVLGGVCAGIADRFNIDTVFVRLVFVALGLVTGLFVALYIILWVVLPANEYNYERSV
ncbi:MAG: PspC domain-containing protein [Bacteroidales bacterium]|nr:PspC domain-containing protein [Bacteroidales bacterium]